jgi:bla regulator protein blaR1
VIVLVNWLWQGLAIVCAAAVALAAARRLNAATRYVVWLLTGTAVLLLPVASIDFMSSVRVAQAPRRLGGASVLLPAPSDWLVSAAAAAWMLFAIVGALRVAAGLARVFRLKRAGTPLDAHVAAPMRSARSGRAYDVRVCEDATGACALGFGRGVILISRTLADALSVEELEAIVLHERAHLARRDHRWQLLQALVSAVAGWHPALWFVGRRLQLEREAACDDRVVVETGAPQAYARALVRAAALQSTGPRLACAAVPGAMMSASTLRRRVQRLLDPSVDRGSRPAYRVAVLTAAALTIGGALTLRLPALVEFVEAEAGLPRIAIGAAAETTQAIRLPHAQVETVVAARFSQTSAAAEAATERPQDTFTATAVSEPAAGAMAYQSPVDPAPAPLAASSLAFAGVVPPSPEAAVPAAPEASSAGPWTMLARAAAGTGVKAGTAGASSGDGAREAGLSIGRFFTRAGKGIAARF